MSPRTTAPARRRARSFRLGSQQEEQRSAWLPAVVAFVVAAVVFGFGGYLVGTPPEEEQMAADIRAADAARDQEQIVSLTTLARDTRDALAPVVEGLGAATGTAAEVATWKQTVATAAKSFDDPPSGSTALADRQLDLAVTTWSVGATQLDQINVDAGHGHQHVFLTGDEHSGAFTPDDAPEGTGHR